MLGKTLQFKYCIDIVITLIYAWCMNTTIQIRIDSALKAKAQKHFKSMGLSLSFVIKYFLTKVADSKKFKNISDLDILISETMQELKNNLLIKNS